MSKEEVVEVVEQSEPEPPPSPKGRHVYAYNPASGHVESRPIADAQPELKEDAEQRRKRLNLDA